MIDNISRSIHVRTHPPRRPAADESPPSRGCSPSLCSHPAISACVDQHRHHHPHHHCHHPYCSLHRQHHHHHHHYPHHHHRRHSRWRSQSHTRGPWWRQRLRC